MFFPFPDKFDERNQVVLGKKKSTSEKAEAPKPEASRCTRCRDWVLMAAPNADDGTFTCYLCRKDPWR